MAFMLFAVALAALAAATDLKSGHIPNVLTVGGLALALLSHAIVGAHQAGVSGAFGALAKGVVGLLLCALVPMLMYARGGMGGGDVKLFAALGAACGPYLGLEIEMSSFVIAALVAPARLAYRGELLRTLGNALALVLNPVRSASKRRPVPAELMTWFRLGPCIFLGTAITCALRGGGW